MKERKRKFDDLPLRSDPNYMLLYRQKNKDRLKELGKKWRKKQIEENPNFYKDKYDQQYQLNYYQNNRKRLLENNWTKRGIEGITYELFLSEIQKQGNKCKICNRQRMFYSKNNKKKLDILSIFCKKHQYLLT